jgi:rhodanese-related sulfurtransferase
MRNPIPYGVTKITVDDAYGRYERGEPVIFADARNPQAWSKSDAKLPRAIRIPSDDARSHVGGIPRGHTIVTYCT